jgi:Asp-tRNA(Asn)/Glu-tRNA(Gln) amidotransferase A subunit family amidase
VIDMTTRPTDFTIAGAAEALAKGDISSRELTQAHLDAMAATRSLNAFVVETPEIALARADEADARRARGEARGPMDGVPVAIKDLFCTEGVATTASSKILDGFVPPYESTVSANLKAAGAVMLGKTSMDEFAMGSANITAATGPVRNPWGPDGDAFLVPGGSSGGSAAAVAARSAIAATGSDTGGSIRQPAAYCGLVGLKPTYGRCSRWGMIAFASSLDQAGPITRTVEDAAIMLGAMAGHDPKDSTSADISVPDFRAAVNRGVKGLKIGIPKEYRVDGMPAEIEKLWADGVAMLKAAGARIVDISLPHTKYALAADVDAGRRFADIAAEMRAADVVMINGEGTIYGNQRKGFYSLFWAWYAKTRLGRSTAIVNHTLQLDDPDMRTMAGIVYPLLDDVVFREPTSYREGCQLAAYGEQHLAADAAFCWQPVTGDEFVERYRRKGAFDIWPWSMKTFRADRPYVCVTGSSALMRPDQAGRLPVAAFRELCLDLGRRFEQVVVVAPDTTDEMLLAPVARDLDLPFIPACTPTPLGLDLLANATVFVSGRWHPSILASTGGTPSVIFSGNSHKMQGLCELLDLPYPAIDATRIGDHVGQLAQMAEDLAGEACGRRNRVLEKAKEAARKSRRNVELLLG